MEKSNLLVGLDIGTTSVKAVVADTSSDKLNVIGVANESTKGMRHGKIVDIDQTASSIAQTLKKVSEKTNFRIHRVVTGIPVGMLQLESANGLINVGEQGREIGDNDVKRVLTSAISSTLKNGQQAITFLPSKFVIDGKTDVDDPRKMIAHSLEVIGILLTVPISDLHNISKSIERAGYQNNFFVPTPLAIASVALNEGERTFGSVILDLGGGTTTATVIHESKIKYATIDFEGGIDITNDISAVLNTSKKEAEKIKLEFGYADPNLASTDNKFPVSVVGKNEPQMIDEQYLSEIIKARLDQILERIGKKLEDHDAFDLPGGIIITGGTSTLQGTDDVVRKNFDIKTKIFQSQQLGLRNPAYAACLGVVRYTFNLSDIDYLVNNVIYGKSTFENTASGNQESDKMKIFKRAQYTSENNSKEDYNKDTLVNKTNNSNENTKSNKNKKQGFKDFLKKFFD